MAEGMMKYRAKEKLKNPGSPAVSLLALYARSSFYKILAALAGLAAAEGVSFYMVCMKQGQSEGVLNPEKMIDMCMLKYLFLAALTLVYFILVVTEGECSSCKNGYTLLRLRISKKGQFAVKTAYNLLCLMLVFAMQILAAYAICRLYKAELPPELVSPQYLFLAFYRNDFLHCILPMADLGKWVCNILLLLALAMDAACSGRFFRVKRGKNTGGNGGRNLLVSVWIYIILVQWFVSESNSLIMLFYALFSVMFIAAALLRLFGVTGGDSDEEA